MRGGVTNLNAVVARLKKVKGEPRRRARQRMIEILTFIHRKVTARTPVWSGEALANWKWTIGRASRDSTGAIPAPGTGDPGKTSKMALGTEPRRPAAQAVADENFNDFISRYRKSKNPFQPIYMTNLAEHADMLEDGLLQTPQTSRSPAGMLRITIEEAKARF